MTKTYVADRIIHWISAFLLLFMLLNLSAELHTVDWTIKGQVEHRQDAIQTHATVGIILLVLTLARIGYVHLFKHGIPRVEPKSQRHNVIIKVTHLALYLAITAMAVSGLLMVNNYDIDLTILGLSLQGSSEQYYDVYPPIHNFHLILKDALWWLIAIHFFGIMYAKR